MKKQQAIQAHTILQRAVCLTLHCRWFGNDRKIDVTALAADADEKAYRAGKKLVDRKVLLPMRTLLGKAKKVIQVNSIPAHRVFGESTALVPIGLVEKVAAELDAIQAELETVAKEFAENDYWPAVLAQKERLGKNWRAEDYASPGEVASKFGIDYYWVSFAAPERLETVDHALFEAAKARYEERLSDAFAETRVFLRDTLRKITEEICKKLQPTPGGDRKVFRDSVLDDLTGFIATFKDRNIADDGELDQVVRQLKAATKGVDPQALRDDDALRQQVFATVQAATSQLDDLMVAHVRAIRAPKRKTA